MSRKEQLAYEILGYPYPENYLKLLAFRQPEAKAITFEQLEDRLGIEREPGHIPELDRALYGGADVFVGEFMPGDSEDVVVGVMDEYIALVYKALEATDNRKVQDRIREHFGMVTYSEFLEKFSKDDYLIRKHWENDESGRGRYISTFKPTFQSYFSLVKAFDNLKVSRFFLKKLALLIPERDRMRHTYICAKTGSGKSELIKMLVYSYMRKPDYCTTVIIEPHGDLCEEVAKFKENAVTENGFIRSKNLIYIDPALDDEYTPSINPFQLRDKSEKNIDAVSQALTSAFEELLKSSGLSLQMQVVLIPCISVLLRMENATIRDLRTFMDDENNSPLVNLGKQSPNEEHRIFFRDRFHAKAYDSTKQSIYTKIQSLLNSPSFANFIGKPSTFDLEEVLNSKGTILFNLSKGKMGDDSSEAAGRFIVALTQSIIKKRVWEHKSKRVPVHMFIDECQNYVSPSIETVLTELRKYGLHLTLANQFIGQNMDLQFKNALLSSTSVKIIGMNNVSSLSILGKETGAEVGDLQKLKIGEFYIKSGDGKLVKIYVPRFLEGEKNSMTPKQWRAILREQKQRYYQRIKPGEDTHLQDEILAGKSGIQGNSRKPKFDL